MRRMIEKLWKQKRDFLINQRVLDPKIWFKSSKHVISELDEDIYHEQKKELYLIELFK